MNTLKYRNTAILLLVFALVFITTSLMAQPGPPPGGGGGGAAVSGASVPLDGGALALLLSGVAYLGRKYYIKNKKEK